VLRVLDEAGAAFVVKLYHPNLTFDDHAWSLLAAADPAHVVGVVETGDAADGSRFEVLEWCEHGTLRHLLEAGHELDVVTVVGELAAALEHIHGLRLGDDPDARLVHQDLKPDNVMVRTLEPLDLVLGDFGLARMIAGSRHYTNRQQGSRAWAPPSGEAVTAGWDWWSLGMIAVEVAAGRHPFCIDGTWLSDAAISDQLSQGPVDLSDIDDDRVLALCRGLLARRTADRWGAEQVRRWLAGETVRVVADSGTGPQRRRRTVLFNGIEHDDPAELALALQQDWDQAQERLIQRTDGGALSQQVSLLLSAAGLTDAEQLLKDTTHPPTRLANLLAEMNPDLPPIYRGHDIRPAALASRLTNPEGAHPQVGLIENAKYGLVVTGVLTLWRHLEGMAGAAETDRRIQDARSFLLGQEKTLGLLQGSTVDSIKAAVYASAVQPESVTVTRAALAALDTSAAEQQTWWKQLAADAGDYAPVLALLSEPFAREQTERVNAMRAAEQEAAERKRVSDQESAKRAAEERERQQLARVRSDRRAATERKWKRWSIPLLVAGALAAWLGIGLLMFVYGEKQDSLFPLLEWPFGWDWVAQVRDWWFQGAGEGTASLDWLAGLQPKDGLALQAGAGLAAAGGVGLVLSFLALKGKGIGLEGRLTTSVRVLRVAVFVVALLGCYAFLPWAFVAMAALFAVLIVIAGIILALWILSEM